MHAIVVRPSCRATRGRRRPGGPVVRTIAPLLAVALPALAVLPSLGCAGDLRRRTVEASTRDWFATLRAAQVLPVYPLTEDLEPGDVFLVTVPIQRQQELYARDGYLPLDLLGPRLDVPSPGYDAFYDDRFWAGRVEGGPPPRPATADDPVRAPRVVFPRLAGEGASDAGLSIGLPPAAGPGAGRPGAPPTASCPC